MFCFSDDAAPGNRCHTSQHSQTLKPRLQAIKPRLRNTASHSLFSRQRSKNSTGFLKMDLIDAVKKSKSRLDEGGFAGFVFIS